MFIGHYAAAFAAKRIEPRASLGTYVLAAQFLDLLWPMFLLAGVEHVRVQRGITAVTPLDFYDYPYSHSLVTTIVWSGVVGGIYYLSRRSLRTALVVGACVTSHWLLDFVVHRPDMPIGLVGPYVGLELWSSKLGTVLVEGGMMSLALALYVGATGARDAVGKWGFIGFVGFLVAIYAAQFFVPPPPDAQAIAWTGIGQWLFVAGAYAIDRHRTSAVTVERDSRARRLASRGRAAS
jgi:hypothetical protein